MDEAAQVTSGLIELAETVGGQAWPHLVRFMFIDALAGLVFGLFLIAGGAISARLALKYQDDLDDGAVKAWVCVGLLACLIGVALTLCMIPGIVTPEGAVLYKILAGATGQ